MSTKNDMMEDGYICKGGAWESPYTGKITSFQPARAEWLHIRHGHNMCPHCGHWMEQKCIYCEEED